MDLLQHRFKSVSTNNPLCDIYDGLIYRERSNFFSNPFNISLTINYDGAPKFKSSNMQLWPLQLCVNELPPFIRYGLDMNNSLPVICALVCTCVHVSFMI